MLQRIQTVFLLLAFILTLLMLFFPLAEFRLDNETQFLLGAFGIMEITAGTAQVLAEVQTYPIAVILFATATLLGISIFLYKKRPLQMRFCVYIIIFLLGTLGMLYFYAITISSETHTHVQYAWPAILPLLSAILTGMAYRGIRKDEKLIKSMDRIR